MAHTVAIPGIVASRLAMSFERCQASSSRSISLRRACKIQDLPSQARDHLCGQGWDLRHRVRRDALGEHQRLLDASADLNAELRQQAADHVDQLGTLFDEQIPRAV